MHNELPRRGAGNGKRTWLSPGYEPKALPLMDMRRRLATPKELEQGQDEMKRADERMKKEALERGEEALEDEARGEAEMSMVSREELEKGTQPRPLVKVPSPSSSCRPRILHLILLLLAMVALPLTSMRRRRSLRKEMACCRALAFRRQWKRLEDDLRGL